MIKLSRMEYEAGGEASGLGPAVSVGLRFAGVARGRRSGPFKVLGVSPASVNPATVQPGAMIDLVQVELRRTPAGWVRLGERTEIT